MTDNLIGKQTKDLKDYFTQENIPMPKSTETANC